jgi:PKD repeat protein
MPETMKKFMLILPALVLLIASCEREPYADFIVSSSRVEVFETVYLTNTSSDYADYFEWDFGDGTWSDAINAAHYYEEAGVYEITLTAYSGHRVIDKRSATVEVLTTTLNVIVEEYYAHHRVANASVILYPTQTDWDNQTNPVVEGYTDMNGVVTFENLNPAIYFVDVWHQNYNNYQLAMEDVGWIMTPQLYRNEVNEFIAYVDYIGTTSRLDGKKIVVYKVLKMEPRIKKYVQ